MEEANQWLRASDGNFVMFDMDIVEDKQASIKEGRPIFKEIPHVTVKGPGMRDAPRFVMIGQYLQRYAREYETWKKIAGGDASFVGTPLSQLPWLTKSECMELRALGIHTAEMLSEMNDQTLGRFPGPGMRRWRDNAKAFIEAAKGAAPITAMNAELAEVKSQLAVALRAIEDFKAAGIEPKRRPGRPRREPEAA